MSAFVLACYMATVASGSIYFKSIRDCLFYSKHLSGQQLETKDGIKEVVKDKTELIYKKRE